MNVEALLNDRGIELIKQTKGVEVANDSDS
jgi:hypothetical protein